MHYEVNVGGHVSKRHVDQLKPYTAPTQETNRDQTKAEPVALESREVDIPDQPSDFSVTYSPPKNITRRILPA